MSAATRPVRCDREIVAAKLDWVRAYTAIGCRVGVLHYPNSITGGCSCGEDCGKNAAKHPLTRVMGGGLTRFTRDPSTVERWLNHEPNANLGIEPPVGYVFFDVDDLAAMQADGRTWPATIQERTGRGGLHLLYRSRVAEIINTVRLLSYLDVRGPGSYLVTTPSWHILRVEYGPWEPAFDLAAVADAPGWIEELLAAKTAEASKPKDAAAPTFTWTRDAEVPAKLAGLLAGDPRVRLTWEGQRADLPSPSEYDMALANVFVRAGWLDQEIVDALTARRREWGHELKRASYYGTTVTRARAANPASASEVWPPRRPLPDAEPVPTLPPELLPSPLRDWLVDAAACASIPLEMVAAPALVTAGALIGHALAIRPEGARNLWFVIPNLWGGIVAPPGMLKTHAIGEATAPLRPLEDEAAEDFSRAKEAADVERMKLQSELARLKSVKGDFDRAAVAELMKALRECEPAEKRYSTSDSTIEKLGEILVANPRGIIVKRDELGGWLTSFNRAGHESDRDFFLDSWEGKYSHTVDRIGRGTIRIPVLCVSVLGAIPPARLLSYVTEALDEGGADGLLQRFQVFVWPDFMPEYHRSGGRPDRLARERAFAVYRALDRLSPAAVGAVQDGTPGSVPCLCFDAEAQGVFDLWRDELEARVRSAELQRTPAFCSHLAKYRSLMPSLALILHLVETVGGPASNHVGIPASAARLAAAWCEYLENHARKVYRRELAGDTEGARLLAAKIEAGDVRDGQAVRELYRPHWAGLKTPEAVWLAVGALEQLAWLRVNEARDGGRPTYTINLHPELKRGRP